VRVRGPLFEILFSLLSSGVCDAAVESSLCSKLDRSHFSCSSKMLSWRWISALACTMICSCSRISRFVDVAADNLTGVLWSEGSTVWLEIGG
jgi:hypothetical protein